MELYNKKPSYDSEKNELIKFGKQVLGVAALLFIAMILAIIIFPDNESLQKSFESFSTTFLTVVVIIILFFFSIRIIAKQDQNNAQTDFLLKQILELLNGQKKDS